MINFNEHVRTLFSHDIESKINLVDVLSPTIAQAAQMLVDCLLADGKVFISGQGGSVANCLHFSTAMLHCFEVERPSLPVINLTGNSSVHATESGQYDQVFAQQIQALGYEKDVLIVLTTSGRSKSLNIGIDIAHDKGMKVIALTGRDGGGVLNHLNANDIELRIPGESSARIRETHLFILHCFCDVIDRSLFGCDAG